MPKKMGIIFIISGTLMLAAAIILAFAVGGAAVPALTVLSIAANSAGVMMLMRGKG